ncbi:MAG: DUF21 domain-containing protein [Melioribacteraceae bacterium]|nr:MAG: DUF21 domain-containing protein [Melioribacteraceae bacterium]
MEVGWSLKFVLILICFMVLAFFSSAEVALFLIDKKRIKEFRKENRIIAGYIESMLDNSRRLLVTILLGTTIVSVGASIVGVDLAISVAKSYAFSQEVAIAVQIVILTILILLIGEVTPKLWANKHPEMVAILVAAPMYWINFIFYPISKVLTDVLG